MTLATEARAFSSHVVHQGGVAPEVGGHDIAQAPAADGRDLSDGFWVGLGTVAAQHTLGCRGHPELESDT